MIYTLSALAQSTWPNRRRIGAIPSSTHIQAINRAAAVLSNLRWSTTIGFPAGGTFSSGTISFFAPATSTGRWFGEIIVQSPNTVSVSGVRTQTMTGTTVTSWTNTSSNVANPTDLRGTEGGTWRRSARMYPTSALRDITAGCPRLQVYGVSGSTPLGVSFFAYPYPGTTTSTSEQWVGPRNDGSMTPGWPDLAFDCLSAAWARAIETELEVAEAMPVVVGVLPIVSGATGLPAWDVALLRRVMTKQIPLARPRRPKALYFAVGSTTTTNPIVQFRVGGQQITTWSTVYSSGAYRLLKARLYDEAYQSIGDVGGVPIVEAELRSFSLTPTGATAWISEDF